jgi:membrane protein
VHPVTRRIIDGTPARLRPGVELSIRTVDDSLHDRVPGLAAEIAFFALLSLPPLLLTVIAGIGEIGDLLGQTWRTAVQRTILDSADVLLSEEGLRTLEEYLLETLGADTQRSIIGLGLLVTLLSASRAFRVVSTAITIAYDLEATRPAWQQRVWGLVLTIGGLAAAMVIGPVLVAGPDGGQTLSNLLGGVPGLPEVWRVAYWPAAAATLTLMLAVLYHVAAPWRTPYRRDVPGALVAMVLWLAGTGALRLYVARAIGESYGFIATPLIILLWLYVSAFAVLLGAELNAEIEKMWPTAERYDPDAARHRHLGEVTAEAIPDTPGRSEDETRALPRVARRPHGPARPDDPTTELH